MLRYFFVTADAPSAQGITLSPRTMQATMKEKNLIDAKITSLVKTDARCWMLVSGCYPGCHPVSNPYSSKTAL
jgi:hypothetical protein